MQPSGQSTVIYFALCCVITLLFVFLWRHNKISLSNFYLLSIGQIITAVTYILVHAVARPYGIGPLTERHTAIIFIPLVVGIVTMFSANDKHDSKINLHNCLLIALIIPGIIYSLLQDRSQLYPAGQSARWSSFVREIKSLPNLEKRSFLIGPHHGDNYWGKVDCTGQLNLTSCIVENANGDRVIRNIIKD